MRWIAAARVATEVVNLASMVVLARLISPAQYGDAAIALVVITLATVLGPGGIGRIGSARSDRFQHMETGQALGMIFGGTCTVVCFAAARYSLRLRVDDG